jgi:hypothetical protein
VSAPNFFVNPLNQGVLNSYLKTQNECFGGRSAPLYGLKRAKKTTTKRHLKENPEWRKDQKKHYANNNHMNHVRAPKISVVTHLSHHILNSAGTCCRPGVVCGCVSVR